MEKVFLDENMPPGVAVAFAGLVRKAVGINEGLTKSQCREADKAAELQAELGPAAILRGHHHVSWVTAIMHTYRRRTYPPGTDNPSARRTSLPWNCQRYWCVNVGTSLRTPGP